MARRFGIIVAVLVFAAVLGTAPLWAASVFPAYGLSLALPLALGASANVLLVVFTGTLYGLADWMALFWTILIEGVLRLALIVGALIWDLGPVGLAWAVVVPFAVTPTVMWFVVRRRVSGRTGLDVDARGLGRNAAHTTVAALAMGSLVSGFPLLLAITAPDASKTEFGLVVLTVTLVRAPIIVVGMTVQSLLITVFRDTGTHIARTLAGLIALVLVIGAIISVAGLVFGTELFEFLFPDQLAPSGPLIAIVAASSALIGVLCVTGPAVLARSRHGAYTAGWVVAAGVTIACLILPLPFEVRTITAMCIGPAAGIVVHIVDLLRSRSSH